MNPRILAARSGRRGIMCAAVASLLLSIAAPAAPSVSAAVGPGSPRPEARFLVAYGRAPGKGDAARVRALGGDVRHSLTRASALAVALPADQVDNLRRQPGVLAVEPDLPVHALDAELDDSWGVERIGAGTEHESGHLGAGVKVAVIDTGIDYEHPELAARYDASCSHDFVNGDDDPADDNGHGTFVAGIIAASMDASGVVGVAPSATICALKVLDADGNGFFSDVMDALAFAESHGVKVTNNSFGSSGDPGTIVRTAYDDALADGILSFAAAGNDGNSLGTGSNVDFPAAYSSVIAVAATDTQDKRASFSSTGSQVELAAPGANITSTLPEPDAYGSGSGTSFSSPHAAGTAALMFGADPCLAAADARSALDSTAEDLGTAGRDTKYGYGLVDAVAAVAAVAPVSASPVIASCSDVAFGDVAPTVDVIVTTDTFKDQASAEDTGNWDVAAGTTGLTLSSVAMTDSTHATVSFTGTAAGGSLTLKVKAAALTTALDSNTLTFVTGPTVSGITASDKTYDGSTSATLDVAGATLHGVDPAHPAVALSTSGATGAFDSKTVGAGKDVTVSGLTLTGADASRYALVQPHATAAIAAKTLTVSGATATKPYDGNAAATVDFSAATLVGKVGSDAVTLTTGGYAASYDDSKVGSGKTVTVTGLALSGGDVGNYSLTQPTLTDGVIDIPVDASAIAFTTVSSGGHVTASFPTTTQTAITVNGFDVGFDAATNVIVTGPSGWDGTFNLPAATNVVVAPPDSGGVAAQIKLSIEVGDGSTALTLDRPVKLTFTGQSALLVGWSRSGSFNAITAQCSTTTTAPTLSAGADCRRNLHGSLLVWTRHLSTFTLYSQPQTTTTHHGSSGGGGGGGGSAAPPPAAPPATLGEVSAFLTASESASPYADPSGSGDYSPSVALDATPTIDVDRGLLTPGDTPHCVADSLIKGRSSAAVYYCGRDGRRYVFVNERTFRSWYKDFSGVIVLPDDVLASIRIGGNVTSRPGVRMVKIATDPKTYAVSRGGVLRWVSSQAVAVRLYGTGWNSKIDDVPDAYFFNYRIGDPIQ